MGSLIDADAMLARLEEWNTSDSTDKALYNFTLHRILEQPTIEPQRKTGQWLLEIGAYFGGHPRFRYHCSVCGNVEEHAYADSKCANFCPNCGARMEGEIE